MGSKKDEKEREDTDDGELDFDDVLEAINPAGKYQIRLAFLLWLSTASAGIAVVTFSFTAFVPKSRCAVPACEDPATATYMIPTGDAGNLTSAFPSYYTDLYNGSNPNTMASLTCGVPMPETKGRPPLAGPGQTETCESYLANVRSGSEPGFCPPENLIFDDTYVSTTLVRDFGFLCDSSGLRAIYSAMYMCGMLIGSFALGFLSDAKGRKVALMVATTLISVPGTIAPLVGVPAVFALMRVLTGMGGIGLFMVPYVIMLENTTPEYIVPLGTVTSLGSTFGSLVVVIAAYFIRDWVPLMLSLHIPMFAGFILYFFVPESPRWLITKGRLAEARKTCRHIAKFNGKELPEEVLYPAPKPEKTLKTAAQLEVESQSEETATVMDLFRPRVIAFRSVNMFYQWFSVTMAYYGITFATTGLAGDPHLNFALGCLTELPGAVFGYYAINFFGRRFILSSLQSLAGIATIIAGLLILSPELKVLQVTLAMIGKFGATCAFGTVYLYTSELYPTSIRGTAVGISSTIARFGGITATLLFGLAAVWPPFPLVIMGAVATVAGVLAVFFPETTGEELPETMEDALNIGKNSNFKFARCSNGKH